MSHGRTATAGLALGVALLLAGCGTSDREPGAAAADVPVGPVGAHVEVPVPGATVAPDPDAGSVPRPAGLSLVVVVPPGADDATWVLVEAVDRWAADGGVGVDLREVVDDADLQAVVDGVGEEGVVVVPGGGLVDELDSVSSQNLHVEFLVLGAQLPEPTANVTAVVWPGATSRGSRAPADDAVDPSSATPDRSDAAAAAGLASVLSGRTGVVVRLDG